MHVGCTTHSHSLPSSKNISSLFWNFNTVWNLWLNIEDCLQEIFHDLVLALLASLLDFLHLSLSILVGILFGLLVSAGVLQFSCQ